MALTWPASRGASAINVRSVPPRRRLRDLDPALRKKVFHGYFFFETLSVARCFFLYEHGAFHDSSPPSARGRRDNAANPRPLLSQPGIGAAAQRCGRVARDDPRTGRHTE